MDIRDKTLTLVGGAGFVGSHIVDQLMDMGPKEIRVLDNLKRGKRSNLSSAMRSDRVRFIEGTITDPATVRDAVRGADGVFHLAALWLGECVDHPRSALDVNIGGTYNVMEACRDERVRRVVYSSSASVYGDALVTPMTEDHPFNNRTFYGATKIAGEQMFRAFHDVFKLDYVGLRYMNIYGPRMDDKGTYVSVIIKVLERLEKGLPPVIYGDGSQSYDFIDVRDVARANILAMQADVTDEFFNVCSGIPTSINELVQEIQRLSGSSATPEYLPQGRSFVTKRLGSTEKAEQLLGFRTQIPLDAGLRDLIAWWRASRPALVAAVKE